ncbi:hypothetical protein ABPG72_020013 [Tetrahymena utriculariae]
MQSNYLSFITKGIIIGLKIAGLPDSQVEKRLKQNNLDGSRHSIARIWTLWKENPSQLNELKQKSGRPQKLDSDNIENLKEYVKENPQLSRKDLQNSEVANPNSLSGQTLINGIKELGFKQKIQQKSIEISEEKKMKRVKWAKSLLRDKKKILQSFIYRNLNQEKYLEMLQEFKSDKENKDEEITYFQQDSARPHSGNLKEKFFDDNDITALPWASQSPDVNTIERIWSLLKWKLEKELDNLEDFDEFKYYAEKTFIQDSDIKKMCYNSINRIPNILYQVIEQEGEVIE